MALFDLATGILYHVLPMLLTTSIVSFNDGSIRLGYSLEVSNAKVVLFTNFCTVVIVLLDPATSCLSSHSSREVELPRSMALALLHVAFFDHAIGKLYHVLPMLLTTSIVSFFDGSIIIGCSMEPVIVDNIVLSQFFST